MPANEESDITQAELEAMMEDVENYLTDEEVESLIQELNGDVSKANPYRDEEGRFSSSGAPGKIGGVAFRSRITPKAAAKGAKIEARKKKPTKKKKAQFARESKMSERQYRSYKRLQDKGPWGG